MSEPTTRYPAVTAADPEVAAALDAERVRENESLVLIASENYCSEAVLEKIGRASCRERV